MTRTIIKIALDHLRLPHSNGEVSGPQGPLLLIAPSLRRAGAGIIAARAAFRGGASAVRLAVPEVLVGPTALAVPEAEVLGMRQQDDGTLDATAAEHIVSEATDCSAVVTLPGLDNRRAHDFTGYLTSHLTIPLLVDVAAVRDISDPAEQAGARVFSLCAPGLRWLTEDLANGIIAATGEEAELLESALAWSAVHPQQVVVLHDCASVGAITAGTEVRVPQSLHGLTVPGSYAALSGLIGGFLAQGLDAPMAVDWALYLYVAAAEGILKEAPEEGILARDIVEAVPAAHRYLRLKIAPRERRTYGLRAGASAT